MASAAAAVSGAQAKVAIIVQQGKVLDFIDGITQRSETPEEHIRQEIAKSLVREYRYPKTDIAVEVPIQIGTRKPRADLVIFASGKPHTQEHARIIVECKAPTVKMSDKDNGVAQLKSYLDACPNTIFGMWINGVERACFRRVERDGKRFWEEVPDLPQSGKEDEADDRPRFDQLKPANSDALLFTFRRCHNFIAGNQAQDREARRRSSPARMQEACRCDRRRVSCLPGAPRRLQNLVFGSAYHHCHLGHRPSEGRVPMTEKQASKANDLRMNEREFDRIMSRALQVKPEGGKKPKKKSAKTRKKK